MESAGNYKHQGNIYSNYKSRPTAKILVATNPNGAAVWISDCFEGSISDKEICIASGFYDFIRKNDMVLADRGFLIEEELREHGAFLNIPPYLKGKKSLDLEETLRTKCISKARIHIERYNKRFKEFKFVSGTTAHQNQPMLSQAVYVACKLANFQPPLAT